MVFKTLKKEMKRAVTFIPGIWTHSTAVPVAFERNSAKVSSAMDNSLHTIIETTPLAISNTIHDQPMKKKP